MRIALVYDRINKWGGAERLLLAFHKLLPEAPLFTAVYNEKTAEWAKVFQITPSFLNRFPFAKTNHEFYPWLTPLAFESFDFSCFDLVISITSADAKGIIAKPQTKHICYCLTPTRYLWSGEKDYFSSKALRFFSQPLVKHLKRWDLVASFRPDEYWAISKNVQNRIRKYYARKAQILYPPVDLDKWRLGTGRRENFYLIVSRLVSYKKVDLAIRAFNHLGLPLKIIGIGKEASSLRRLAKTNISFLGQLTDLELLSYYQKCKAVIFPQEEDFGLVPLEVQACGSPVIAFGAGGAKEAVIDKRTGLFFYPQNEEALEEKVRQFESSPIYNRYACRKQAEKFSTSVFEKKALSLINKNAS